MSLRKAAPSERPSVLLARHRQEIVDIVARNKGVDVHVFGSVSRGDDRPGSDVDLLVKFAKGASLLDLVAIAQDAEDLLGVHVDVISEGGLSDRRRQIRDQAVAL